MHCYHKNTYLCMELIVITILDNEGKMGYNKL